MIDIFVAKFQGLSVRVLSSREFRIQANNRLTYLLGKLGGP